MIWVITTRHKVLNGVPFDPDEEGEAHALSEATAFAKSLAEDPDLQVFILNTRDTSFQLAKSPNPQFKVSDQRRMKKID